MSVSVARAIAFDILVRVESEGAYASDLLHAELGAQDNPRAASIKPEDAALATEITLGVLRWRRLLDFLLAPQLKKPVSRLDLPVAIALRVGLYQLRFLRRIPARAAVNESVELVKRAKKSSAAALVNAVLRRVAADAEGSSPAGSVGTKASGTGAATAYLAASDKRLALLSPADRLATLHSHPTWLVDRWLARFGEERTLALLDANDDAPRLSCALHDPDHRDDILAGLRGAGLRVERGTLLTNAFAVSGGSVTRTEAFRNGAISIQDEASQAVPLLLDTRAGHRVLDLCAAPGGKTPPLARAAGPNGVIVAADRHAHRLRAMRAQFERLHLDKIHIVELDAEKPLPFTHKFDRILVDAPCSGTGTLARHPEIRWRLQPGQLAEFHRLQVAILTSALDALAPGGRLVYSTCSLEPEENELVVAEVFGRSIAPSASSASNHRDVKFAAMPSRAVATSAPAPETIVRGISLLPRAKTIAALTTHLAPGVDSESLVDSSGFFRTLPGVHSTDGFFAAVLERKGP
jgi:16S rRNA (cytosine967-C5)-methyltransferase